MTLQVTKVTNLEGENGISRILRALTESGRPMTTMEVYNHPYVKNNLTYSSVKIYLRRLLHDGKVRQLFKRGPYEVTKTTYGLDGVGLAIHNFRLQFLYEVSESKTYDRSFGDIHIYITFGVKRGKITGTFAKRDGLSYSELNFCVDFFREKCEEAIGRYIDVDELKCLFVELGNDYLHRRVDKTVTFSDFQGTVERVYQKDDSTVRREVTIKDTSVEAILALHRGGLPQYHLVQSQFQINQELREMNEGRKFTNRLQGEILSLLRALLRQLASSDKALSVEQDTIGHVMMNDRLVRIERMLTNRS